MEKQKKANWSRENLSKLISESSNYTEVYIKLKVAINTRNKSTLNKYIKIYDLDASHLSKKIPENIISNGEIIKTPLSNYLRKKKIVDTTYIKNRLIKEGILLYECKRCGIFEWQGEKLSLHMDHIDGDNTNNLLSNLQLLCPNCHSLTPTYCGRNASNKLAPSYCITCNKSCSHGAKQCKECAGGRTRKPDFAWPDPENLKELISKIGIRGTAKQIGIARETLICHLESNSIDHTTIKRNSSDRGKRKGTSIKPAIGWPTIKEIIELVEANGFLQTGKDIGVSDNAVRNHLRSEGIDLRSLNAKFKSKNQ